MVCDIIENQSCQSCKITLCQYRHYGTNVIVDTVDANDKNDPAMDIDKFCDEYLAEKSSKNEDYEEEDLLSDSFIDKIMKDREIKLKFPSSGDDDDDLTGPRRAALARF